MNRRVLLLLIVFVLLVAVTALIFSTTSWAFVAWGDNLVCNGSFETGNFVDDPAGGERIMDGSMCKALCGGSSALSDWQVSKGLVTGAQSCNNAQDAICWIQSPNTDQINAEDGQRSVDLTGFLGRPPLQFGAVQQTVGSPQVSIHCPETQKGTQKGELYELSFEIGSSSTFQPPPPNPRIGIMVQVSGVPNAEFDVTIPITEVSHWERRTMRFRAVDTTTTIIFTGVGNPPGTTNGNGGDYVGLDNVSLRKVCSLFDWLFRGCR
jgi:hypothetical protein